jgi:hypothetical protein
MKMARHFKWVVSFGNRLSPRGVACIMAAVLLALFGAKAQAAVIAQYNFTGSLDSSSDTEPNSGAGTFTPVGLTGGTGTTIDTGVGNPAPSFNIDQGAMPVGVDHSRYVQFIVTANSGYFLNLSGTGALGFDGLGDGVNWYVRSSVDNYANDIVSGTFGASFANNSADLSASFDQLTSVTFRLYAWKGNNTDVFFDNITLNGTVSPVPEVGTVWAGLLVVGLAIAGKARLGKKMLA